MPKLASLLARIAIPFALVLAGGSAFAAGQRTFVASYGSDLAVCSIAQPCRSFGRAMTQTNTSGEIIVLDSAGYGAVTITQPASIIAPAGVYAGISVFSGDGVTINAPGAVVVLRGLTINGQGGDTGINVVAAQEVHVESTIVANMGLSGIFINTAASLLIKDSSFRDNVGSGIGIYAGSITAENVRSESNGAYGLYIQGGFASVGASFFNQNFGAGVRAEGGRLTAHSTMIAGNGSDGVFNHGATVALEGCSVDANGGHGVNSVGSLSAFAYTKISGGSVKSNGIRGLEWTNDYARVTATGVTAFGNVGFDLDANFCCFNTFQNNSFESASYNPVNVNLLSYF